MSEKPADRQPHDADDGASQAASRSLWRRLWVLFRDGIAIGGWVLVLTLLFLATGWPRWTFYTLLLLGVVVYVRATKS